MLVNKDIDKYILIHNALVRKGLKAADAARDLNIKPPTVHKYMYGIGKSIRFNQWVKDNLGIELPKHKPRKRKEVH